MSQSFLELETQLPLLSFLILSPTPGPRPKAWSWEGLAPRGKLVWNEKNQRGECLRPGEVFSTGSPGPDWSMTSVNADEVGKIPGLPRSVDSASCVQTPV